MPVVTVQIGAVCGGGGHVEVITLVDGLPVSRESRDVTEMIRGRSVREADAAKDRLLSETSASDLAEYKTRVEAKSIVIEDPRTDDQPGGTLGTR